MPRYRVLMQVDGMISVDVQADDEEKAKVVAETLVADDDWCDVYGVDKIGDD